MNLILWRHAEAEIQRPGQDDIERELTAKGRRQARRVAKWLDARLPASIGQARVAAIAPSQVLDCSHLQ